MDIPKQVQDKLAQFQGLQNQLQVMALQKQQLIVQSNEVDNALTELEKAGKDSRIYRAAGPLLVETNKEEGEKNLREDKELASTRIQILEKQEKKLVEKYNELKTELQGMLGVDGGKKGGAGKAA